MIKIYLLVSKKIINFAGRFDTLPRVKTKKNSL